MSIDVEKEKEVSILLRCMHVYSLIINLTTRYLRLCVCACMYGMFHAMLLQFVSMRKATLAHDDMQFKAPLPSGTSSSSAPADSSSIPPDVLPPPPPPPPSSSFLLLRTLEAGIKDERHDLLEVR